MNDWTTTPTEPGFYWARNYKYTAPEDRSIVKLVNRFDPFSGKPFLALINLEDLHRSDDDEMWYSDFNPLTDNPNSRSFIGQKIDVEVNYEIEFCGPLTTPTKTAPKSEENPNSIWSEEIPTENGRYWVYNPKNRSQRPWVGRLHRRFNQWSGELHMVLIGIDRLGDAHRNNTMVDELDNNPDTRLRRIIGKQISEEDGFRFAPITQLPPVEDN